MLAPIVLFVYNRPFHTERTLNALQHNYLAEESILFIFSDGPKSHITPDQLEKIEQVRTIIHSKQWCKEVIIRESIINKGLANSIIDGVTEIVNKYGKVIVLEDDIVTSKGFLRYMNDALSFYQDDSNVMHIAGYMYPHKKKLPKTFFYNVPLCWGWGTWERAWMHFNPDAEYLYNYFDQHGDWGRFNKFGNNELQKQLKANVEGELNTWFVKWHASLLIQNGYTLFPNESMVVNEGFDNTGIHCECSQRYQGQICESVEVKKIPIEENEIGGKIIKNFYVPQLSMREVICKYLKRIFPVTFLKRIIFKVISFGVPEIRVLRDNGKMLWKSHIAKNAVVFDNCRITNSVISDYTYISYNSTINNTVIGKYCSIGPNLLCGWGIHPLDGISTHPVFYSSKKQIGFTYAKKNKIEETKPIFIGNDVFIGANVTILDGTTIGDGAVIGAGSVVTKDVPPYSISFGVPCKVSRYRFNQDQIEKLLNIKWWDYDNPEKLKDIERDFFNIDQFIMEHEKE
ncbi:MAG: DapH/DapD/GlmU-related protein [Bacteroidales bacterium]